MVDRSTISAGADASRFPAGDDEAARSCAAVQKLDIGNPDPWLILAAAWGRAAARSDLAKATSGVDEQPPTAQRRTSRRQRQ